MSWKLNGTVELGETLAEERTWNELVLTFRYDKDDIQSEVQSILDKSEKGQLVEIDTGGFRTVDTGDGSNDIELTPPDDRSSLRTVDEWYVDDYSRELVDRDGDTFDVELSLLPIREKSFDNEFGSFDSEPSQSTSNDLWNFDFTFGNVVTRTVSVDTSETPDGSTELNELTLTLSLVQARIVEENCGELNLAKLREVPDGVDVLEDVSRDSRNTVDITPPFGRDEPIPAGDYVIREWSTEWIGGAFRVELEVGKS